MVFISPTNNKTTLAMNPVITNIRTALNKIILGKPDVIDQALICLLAQGHLLIEDVPGKGKTVLATALAKVMGMDYQRIQFTSDLLPADIIGVSVFDQNSTQFTFHQGPLFNQFILADEVNRATPKTQSALLEAMEENAITVDGVTYQLPKPFFVIATQNPKNQIGTFALPESQLDRFLMRIHMGEMSAAAERELLMGEDRRAMLNDLNPVTSPTELLTLQNEVSQVDVTSAIVDYLHALLHHSRNSGYFAQGLSPRAGLGIKRAAQASAFIDGRNFATPEDIQAVILHAASHRLFTKEHEAVTHDYLYEHWINAVPIIQPNTAHK